MSKLPQLTDEERATYEWQMWVSDFGEEGQRKLKAASVMISRVGGVGSVVAYELAAAGIGKLVLAHAGNVKPSDLNRQLLMTHDWLGKPRIESIKRRLLDLNPRLEIVDVAENVNESNVEALVRQCDLIVDCAPLFPERFAMNRQAVLQNKPLGRMCDVRIGSPHHDRDPGPVTLFAVHLSRRSADLDTTISSLWCGLRHGCLHGGDGSD